MNCVKQTKKYNVYEIVFQSLGKFILKDPLYYEDKYKMNKVFSIVKFENKATGYKSQCECYQEDTLNDLKNDIEKIHSGEIKGTKFYCNWIKVIFEKGKTYSLMVDGVATKGTFYGQDTFKKKTFYFIVNQEKVKADGIVFNGYSL